MLPPAGLPVQFSSFVGRDADVRQLSRMLSRDRLVTLAGPGGIGKTRLALETARALVPEFPDGCWFIDLSEVARPDQVIAKLASSLGQQEETGRALAESVVTRLRDIRALIVLDNCEHVLEPTAMLVATLMASCLGVTIAATSRERLGIPGETIYQVTPLTMPADVSTLVPEAIAEFAAVRLFFDRAAAAGVELTAVDNAARVASICRRVDGLPLAIELAAARVRVLTLDQIANRLGDRLALLVRGQRTAPGRHRTLRATVQWSYDLLVPAEQSLLRRLSIFSGGFSLESAEDVGSRGGIPRELILDLLTNLVEKSLLLVEVDEQDARYRMLQTIREFALEALSESGEAREVRHHHAEHFGVLAAVAEPALEGAEQALWLRRLERERDNLSDALAWCTSDGDRALGRRIAASLWRFWFIRGYFAEGRRWLELVLDPAVHGPDVERAKTLRCLAVMLRVQGDYRAAHARLTEALAIYRRRADTRGTAMTLNSLGIVTLAMGDFEGSFRILGGECRTLYRQLGDLKGVATCLNNMGNASRAKGDYEATRALCLESLALYRQAGFREGEAASLLNLGLTAQATADLDEARRRYFASLDIYLALGYREGVAEALEALGMLAAVEGHAKRSARLLGAGERLRELVGAPIPFKHEQAEHDRVAGAVRSALGDEAFGLEREIGRSLTMKEAVTYAANAEGVSATGAGLPGGLTRRELQVAALVAGGLKDRDIAERLHISPRTAGKHVEHIRDKLGLRSRSELGAWVTRLGLLDGAPP